MATSMTGERTDRGWAGGADPRRRRLSYVPEDGGPDDDEPPYTIVDYWEPPHPMAVPPDLCDELKDAADGVRPRPSGNGVYFHNCLEPYLMGAVRERGERANELWWRLDLTSWEAGLKRYRVDQRHPTHQDILAGAARRKLAGVIQLSDPDDYEGGTLVIIGPGAQRIEMPRARGSLIVFPGWAMHKVERVTRGTRWSLCFNAYGPPLR